MFRSGEIIVKKKYMKRLSKYLIVFLLGFWTEI